MIRLYDSSMGYMGAVTEYASLDIRERFYSAGEMTLTLMTGSWRRLGASVGCFAVTDGGELYCLEKIRASGDETVLSFDGALSQLRCCVVPEAQRYLPFTTRAARAIELTVNSFGAGAFPMPLYIEKCGSDRKLRSVIGAGCLYDAVTEAAQGAGLGMRVYYEGGDVVFALSEGRESNIVLWDEALAARMDCTVDIESYRNRAVVIGDSEESGIGSISAEVTAAECQFDDGWEDGEWGERSVMVKAGDIKRADYTTVVSEGQGISFFDRAAYVEALRGRGAAALSSMRPAFTVSVSGGADLGLCVGDIVTVRRGDIALHHRAAVSEKHIREAGGEYSAEVRLSVI